MCVHLHLVTEPRMLQVYAVTSVTYHTCAPSERPVRFSLLALLCIVIYSGRHPLDLHSQVLK